VQISSASQPITATSLFFQRRWKLKRSFLHSERSLSIPSSHYTPAVSSNNYWHSYGTSSRQILGRRGGGASTSAMSAAVVTTEESQSASSSVESNDNNVQDVGCNNNDSSDDDNTDNVTQSKLVLIHTYNCTKASLMGLGIGERQFATWVQYYLSNSSNDTLSTIKSASSSATIEDIMNNISTQEVHWENDWENHVKTLRQYWNDEKLLCEHTNYLTDWSRMGKIKNKKKQQIMKQKRKESNVKSNGSAAEDLEEEEKQMKYEHFRKLLMSHANRLVNIVEDELSDASFMPCSDDEGSNKAWNTQNCLLGWIENEYGAEKTRALMANRLLMKSEKEQLEVGAFDMYPFAIFSFCHHLSWNSLVVVTDFSVVS
jgi:hypothetical protein